MTPDPTHSIEGEPTLRGGQFDTDPAERGVPALPDRQDEIDAIRDGVANEPHLAGPGPTGPTGTFGAWVAERRRHTTPLGTLGVTLLAALAGGPFAIAGAFMASSPGLAGGLYVILFGPIVEEFLKQSGMIYLLERKPYRVVSRLQFVACAAVSALLFATLENLMYIHLYTAAEDIDHAALAQFRWTVCTALHICCAVIASLGLNRVWQRMQQDGKPADLSHAYPLFITAIAVHGVYNLGAMLMSDIF